MEAASTPKEQYQVLDLVFSVLVFQEYNYMYCIIYIIPIFCYTNF